MQMKPITSRSGADRRRKIGEILRFGIVGVLATLIQYGVYRGLLLFIQKGSFACIDYSVPMPFSNARCTPRYTALANVSPNRE